MGCDREPVCLQALSDYQPLTICGRRNRLGAGIDEDRLALKEVLDDHMVVDLATVELHSDRTSGNPHRHKHRTQKDDMIVAIAIGISLLADGVEQHQRGLDEFPAIRVGEVDHLPHHPLRDGGRIVADIVVDAGREQRESRSPDAGITAKLIDDELDGTDDRPRIRGVGADGNPMNGPVRCEQVLPNGDSGCRLVGRLAC